MGSEKAANDFWTTRDRIFLRELTRSVGLEKYQSRSLQPMETPPQLPSSQTTETYVGILKVKRKEKKEKLRV
jgi:hypothetical protein